MPSIQITERLARTVNQYLGREFFTPLDEGVKKYAGADEDVSKYKSRDVINTGKLGDGEINYTLYTRSYDIQGSYAAGTIGIVNIFGFRFLSENSNVSTIYGSRAKILFPFDVPGMGKKREDANVGDPLKTKIAIAAIFGPWEVGPEFLTEHAQEIDALRGQIFENWQSGISSIDEYFVA